MIIIIELRLKTFVLLFIVVIAIVCNVQKGFSQSTPHKSLDYYIRNAPFKMSKIPEPTIPDRSFNIKKFGATGHGKKLNTKAIQHTIDAAEKAGGGKVIIPPGLWLTAPIELKSNINLHIERGAILLFTKDHSKFPIIKMAHTDDYYQVMPPIYGHDLTNVAITGRGVVDGNGQSWRPVKKYKVTADHWHQLLDSGGALNADSSIWWPSKKALDGEQYIDSLESHKKNPTAKDYRPARTYMRPYMLVIMYSKNVLIDGPTFRNSPKFALIPKYCQNLIIRNIRVDNAYWAQNGDGIDIEGGKNVAVYNNDVTAGDDGICMKSSPTDDKNFSAPALKNVIVADNVVHHGHGGFVIGSNTDGGIKNVDVRDCDFIGTDRGLRFKSYRGNGGLVRDIYINDIYMTRIVKQAIYFNTYYHSSGKAGQPEPVTKKTPRFRDFHISHIYCDGAHTAVSMTGLPEMPVKNITLSDIRITAKQGFSANEVEHINMKNFTVLPESGTTYSLKNSRDILFDNVAVPHNMSTFLKLSGRKTSHIKFKNVKLPESKQQVKFGPEVKKTALKINDGT